MSFSSLLLRQFFLFLFYFYAKKGNEANESD